MIGFFYSQSGMEFDYCLYYLLFCFCGRIAWKKELWGAILAFKRVGLAWQPGSKEMTFHLHTDGTGRREREKGRGWGGRKETKWSQNSSIILGVSSSCKVLSTTGSEPSQKAPQAGYQVFQYMILW